MNEEWSRLKRSIGLANTTSTPANAVALKTSLKRAVRDTVDRCRAERKRARALETPKDLSDAAVLEAARWTDRLPLRDYEGVLHLVPRLVNVVTLAEAVPVPGSGLKLPLDLHTIGARCSNAYFAPRRFAAVQLAFDSPRCRVLVFHTGRLVGTGAFSSPFESRLCPSHPAHCPQVAPARWPRGSPSCAPRASWPSRRACTCTCGISR